MTGIIYPYKFIWPEDSHIKLYDLGTVIILCDLEDLKTLIEPSLCSRFYIQSFSLLNRIYKPPKLMFMIKIHKLLSGLDVYCDGHNNIHLCMTVLVYKYYLLLEYSCNKCSNLIGQLEVHYFTYRPPERSYK